MSDAQQEPRPRRRRRRLWLAVALVCLLAGAASAFPYVTGRVDPPVYSRHAAMQAVEGARAAAAARWAPSLLERAEATLRESLAEHRRQELRFFVLRDFDEARVGFHIAEEQGRQAEHEARSEHERARGLAEKSLREAEAAVSEANALVHRLNIGAAERRHLLVARMRVSEANTFWEAEDYASVELRAKEATTRVRQAFMHLHKTAARYLDHDQVRNWRRWIDDTIAWSRSRRAPAIIVNKDKNILALYDSGRLLRTYHADMGSNNTESKRLAGDNATPEGRYRIVSKKDVGNSRYHRALLLDYPNAEDQRRFRELKRQGRVSRNASLGSLIEIHGEGGRGDDWTRGCVALSNRDMDDLFRRVPPGTPVTIVAGDGTNGILSDLARRLQTEPVMKATR
jgi:hypothetical protein